jgi:hypothetical protein
MAYPVAPPADPDTNPYAPLEALGLPGSLSRAPSLPLLTMMERIAAVDCGDTPTAASNCTACADAPCNPAREGHPAILALAPETTDAALRLRVDEFRTWLLLQLDLLICGGVACNAPQQFAEYIRVFESETGPESLEEYVGTLEYDAVPPTVQKVGIALVLQAADPAWRYAIRANFTSPIFGQQQQPTPACLYNTQGGFGGTRPCGYAGGIPPTNIPVIDNFRRPVSPNDIQGYGLSGFLTLQNTIDRWILDISGTVPEVRELIASVAMFPTREFRADNFFELGGDLLGLFFMLSFIFPVSRFVRAIVIDKEKRIKESMKIMGVFPSVIDLAWFLTMGLQMLITSIGFTIALSVGVYTFSNVLLLWLFVLSFCAAVVTLCFLLAVFFNKSKAAAIAGPMLFFALYFPYYSVSDPSTSGALKETMCLFAPTCMALGAGVFVDWESGQVGVQWGNMFDETGNISYFACLVWLIFDFVLYGLLAVYLDKVLPSEYGTRRPWHYPITDMCSRNVSRNSVTASSPREGDLHSSLLRSTYSQLDDEPEPDPVDPSTVEAVSGDLMRQVAEARCINVKGLRKVFPSSATGGTAKVAVDNLHLDMYEGQITVLLGHNGAGKTTTISMLTGLIPPSAGDANVRGHKLTTDMAQIRKSIGLCPQHDVLFPELNVTQHLVRTPWPCRSITRRINAPTHQMCCYAGDLRGLQGRSCRRGERGGLKYDRTGWAEGKGLRQVQYAERRAKEKVVCRHCADRSE